jgi:coenzyme F420-reducing hydrogenase gamma subunit
VDYELRGCPVNKYQLLEVLNAFLNHREPNIFAHSVCMECKARGITCVMVARGIPCMGPVTHAGCNGLCPSFDRGCFGCYGPKEAPNTSALASQFVQLGMSSQAIARSFRGFNAGAESFRRESELHER